MKLKILGKYWKGLALVNKNAVLTINLEYEFRINKFICKYVFIYENKKNETK